MLVLAAIAVSSWTAFANLEGPWRFITALLAAVLVAAVIALCLWIAVLIRSRRSNQGNSLVVDAYSKPYASKATSLIIPKVIATVMVVAAFTNS